MKRTSQASASSPAPGAKSFTSSPRSARRRACRRSGKLKAIELWLPSSVSRWTRVMRHCSLPTRLRVRQARGPTAWLSAPCGLREVLVAPAGERAPAPFLVDDPDAASRGGDPADPRERLVERVREAQKAPLGPDGHGQEELVVLPSPEGERAPAPSDSCGRMYGDAPL